MEGKNRKPLDLYRVPTITAAEYPHGQHQHNKRQFSGPRSGPAHPYRWQIHYQGTLP